MIRTRARIYTTGRWQGPGLNRRPLDYESSALPLRHPALLGLFTRFPLPRLTTTAPGPMHKKPLSDLSSPWTGSVVLGAPVGGLESRPGSPPESRMLTRFAGAGLARSHVPDNVHRRSRPVKSRGAAVVTGATGIADDMAVWVWAGPGGDGTLIPRVRSGHAGGGGAPLPVAPATRSGRGPTPAKGDLAFVGVTGGVLDEGEPMALSGLARGSAVATEPAPSVRPVSRRGHPIIPDREACRPPVW